MQAGARFEIRRVRGIPIVVVDGELDVSNARSFEAALVRAAKTDRHVVVVPLDKVTYLDNYAINVLLRFGERLTQNRQSLALVLPEQEAGRRVLEITEMEGRYPVFPSIEPALDAIRGLPLYLVPPVKAATIHARSAECDGSVAASSLAPALRAHAAGATTAIGLTRSPTGKTDQGGGAVRHSPVPPSPSPSRDDACKEHDDGR